jgi:hypothetical protein
LLALLAASIIVPHPARADMQAIINDLKRDEPPEVATFIDRRAGCNYWSSEPPFDSERVAEIKKVMDDLKCHALAHDEKNLRARYAKSPSVLKALDETRNLTY